jgi:hypothetical protein
VPDVAALESAARAAIVMPAVFALAREVIGQPQTSLFAAFGSFATFGATAWLIEHVATAKSAVSSSR